MLNERWGNALYLLGVLIRSSIYYVSECPFQLSLSTVLFLCLFHSILFSNYILRTPSAGLVSTGPHQTGIVLILTICIYTIFNYILNGHSAG